MGRGPTLHHLVELHLAERPTWPTSGPSRARLRKRMGMGGGGQSKRSRTSTARTAPQLAVVYPPPAPPMPATRPRRSMSATAFSTSVVVDNRRAPFRRTRRRDRFDSIATTRVDGQGAPGRRDGAKQTGVDSGDTAGGPAMARSERGGWTDVHRMMAEVGRKADCPWCQFWLCGTRCN